MTDATEPRLWELRPRCLVICPDLSLEEFAEGPWASVRAIHESVNFHLGDALNFLDRFGEAGSQLLDDGLTPARMAQLKWVSQSIPPARRRDGCNWTIHRIVAGLFSRRGRASRLFPAHYLDRKAELQDELLARAEAEKWHSPTMLAEVERLEEEAREYASNSAPRADEDASEPGQSVVGPDEALYPDAGSFATALSEHGDDDAARDRASADLPAAVAASDEVRASEMDAADGERNAAAAGQDVEPRTSAGDDRDGNDGDRLRSEIVAPAPADLGATILAPFPASWHDRITIAVQRYPDSGAIRWFVQARKPGQKQAVGVGPDLAKALAEAGRLAEESDELAAQPKPRAPLSIPVYQAPERGNRPPLIATLVSMTPRLRERCRDWMLRGHVFGEAAPDDAFGALWHGADDGARKAAITFAMTLPRHEDDAA